MSLTRINQNISSLNAQRNLERNSNRIGQSIERLSSGLRINRGGDDPAGLVISELLRAQVSGLDVAQQNASQGVNLIKTAEGALDEISGLLRQMRELAVDAASDSNKNADARAALQSQVESALTTIDQIARTRMYAGRAAGMARRARSVNIVNSAAAWTSFGPHHARDPGPTAYVSLRSPRPGEGLCRHGGPGALWSRAMPCPGPATSTSPPPADAPASISTGSRCRTRRRAGD